MTEETSYYLERLREEGYTHDQVLEELDDLVQSGRMSKELHSILLSAQIGRASCREIVYMWVEAV